MPGWLIGAPIWMETNQSVSHSGFGVRRMKDFGNVS